DFDHNTTIQKELQECKRLNIIPVFGYTSFSHTEEEHRFRLAFVTDEVITDIDKRNKLQITLINIFENSDKVTYDPTRIFYGGKGKEPIEPNYDARINADEIINKYYKEEYDVSKPIKKFKRTNTHKTIKTPLTDDYIDNINAIKSLNVEKLQSLITVDRKKTVSSEKEIYDFINDIDLEDFLGF